MAEKLKVLFVSGELIAGDLAYRLKKEGCDVKLYVKDLTRNDCFDGMIEKTDDWEKELDWVGKDGLIVFDDVGYGKVADNLRSKGFTVFGGSEKGDKLEKERDYAQSIFSVCDIKVLPSIDFKKAEDAIDFVKKNKGAWVVKQNGHDGSLSYVGELENGDDTISMLNSLNHGKISKSFGTISLQKKIKGVEVAVSRCFNGKNWVSPILVNFEHKCFLDGDRGPLTSEMGTLAWYDNNENNRIFLETLHKIEPFLKHIDYKGFIDINCIINEDGLFPLEATMRFGSPTNHLQSEIQVSPWSELLYSAARGDDFELIHKKDYSVVVSIAVPPFPYKSISSEYYPKDVQILFREKLTDDEINRIHFEEVKMVDDKIYIAGNNGYILFITGSGKDVESARKNAYDIVNKLVMPKMLYRTDIGLKYINRDKKLLKKWKWI